MDEIEFNKYFGKFVFEKIFKSDAKTLANTLTGDVFSLLGR